MDVRDSGLCIGCGLCVLEHPDKFELTQQLGTGYLLPSQLSGGVLTVKEEERFTSYCPGLGYGAPKTNAPHSDSDWGPFRAVLRAWSLDHAMRYAGSSGGVLSQMLNSLLRTGRVSRVVSLVPDEADPLQNRGLSAKEPSELGSLAASRYAPGTPLLALRDIPAEERVAVVAKPCEIGGLRSLMSAGSATQLPRVDYLLSFFCAGMPSREGTRALLVRLDIEEEDVAFIRYRGNGWPGHFEVTLKSGEQRRLTYDESWGSSLNRHLHDRCKLCVDSVGHQADVVAADIWETDARGYPIFAEGDGVSALMVRTARGDELLSRCAGDLHVESTDLAALKRAQPMQIERRRMAWARGMGRRAAGRHAPAWPGFITWRFVASQPLRSLRQARGSWSRARRRRTS